MSIVLHESPLPSLLRTLDRLGESLRDAAETGLLAASRVTLVDNASSPAYRSALETALANDGLSRRLPSSRAQIDFQDGNPGFGSAHNRANRGAEEDFLLILNPDVELAAGALQTGMTYLREHPEVVAVNPCSRRADGSREYLCKRYPALFDLLLRGFATTGLRRRFNWRLAHYEYRDLDDTRASAVELLSGACLLCRREAFLDADGFDEGFFLYFEDFDLSLRLAQGGALHFVPSFRIVHHGGNAASKGWRHRRWFLRSALRFYGKHGWKLQ
ncbi:MAG: glycosyltransferase [Pseudomonadota bacterium]